MSDAQFNPGRFSVASWVLYDLANTIFALGVIGFYFSDWLISEDLPDSALAAVQIAAAIVVIFLAPWAGARSDVRGTKRPALAVTTTVAVVATATLASGPIWLTLFMAAIAVAGVNTGSVVYDALLVDVSSDDNRGLVSGLGVGVGYFGSFIGLAIGTVAREVFGWGHAATFRTLALFFMLFAIPAFVFINERPGFSGAPLPTMRSVAIRLVQSWKMASRYDGVVRFLAGRFFYTDAINTLISGFLAIFVIDELGLDREFFTILLSIAIAAAAVGGFGGGWMVSRAGPLRVLRATLLLWVLAFGAGIGAAVTDQTSLAWLIGPLGGIALGATWSADRVVMTRISPPRFLGEFYGLYATVGRFATILGPLVWAGVVDAFGLSRNVAMFVLAVFVSTGWWVLRRVDDSPRDWPEHDLLVEAPATDQRQGPGVGESP